MASVSQQSGIAVAEAIDKQLDDFFKEFNNSFDTFKHSWSTPVKSWDNISISGLQAQLKGHIEHYSKLKAEGKDIAWIDERVKKIIEQLDFLFNNFQRGLLNTGYLTVDQQLILDASFNKKKNQLRDNMRAALENMRTTTPDDVKPSAKVEEIRLPSPKTRETEEMGASKKTTPTTTQRRRASGATAATATPATPTSVRAMAMKVVALFNEFQKTQSGNWLPDEGVRPLSDGKGNINQLLEKLTKGISEYSNAKTTQDFEDHDRIVRDLVVDLSRGINQIKSDPRIRNNTIGQTYEQKKKGLESAIDELMSSATLKTESGELTAPGTNAIQASSSIDVSPVAPASTTSLSAGATTAIGPATPSSAATSAPIGVQNPPSTGAPKPPIAVVTPSAPEPHTPQLSTYALADQMVTEFFEFLRAQRTLEQGKKLEIQDPESLPLSFQESILDLSIAVDEYSTKFSDELKVHDEMVMGLIKTSIDTLRNLKAISTGPDAQVVKDFDNKRDKLVEKFEKLQQNSTDTNALHVGTKATLVTSFPAAPSAAIGSFKTAKQDLGELKAQKLAKKGPAASATSTKSTATSSTRQRATLSGAPSSPAKPRATTPSSTTTPRRQAAQGGGRARPTSVSSPATPPAPRAPSSKAANTGAIQPKKVAGSGSPPSAAGSAPSTSPQKPNPPRALPQRKKVNTPPPASRQGHQVNQSSSTMGQSNGASGSPASGSPATTPNVPPRPNIPPQGKNPQNPQQPTPSGNSGLGARLSSAGASSPTPNQMTAPIKISGGQQSPQPVMPSHTYPPQHPSQQKRAVPATPSSGRIPSQQLTTTSPQELTRAAFKTVCETIEKNIPSNIKAEVNKVNLDGDPNQPASMTITDTTTKEELGNFEHNNGNMRATIYAPLIGATIDSFKAANITPITIEKGDPQDIKLVAQACLEKGSDYTIIGDAKAAVAADYRARAVTLPPGVDVIDYFKSEMKNLFDQNHPKPPTI